MDIVVAPRDGGAAWDLRDLLGRPLGVITKQETGFLIAPAGAALNTMQLVARGPHAALDDALSEIEARTRGVCRRAV